jgi:hypothetical protein
MKKESAKKEWLAPAVEWSLLKNTQSGISASMPTEDPLYYS